MVSSVGYVVGGYRIEEEELTVLPVSLEPRSRRHRLHC
jgi:hypothetical protein